MIGYCSRRRRGSHVRQDGGDGIGGAAMEKEMAALGERGGLE